jgi:hypothetical protein
MGCHRAGINVPGMGGNQSHQAPTILSLWHIGKKPLDLRLKRPGIAGIPAAGNHRFAGLVGGCGGRYEEKKCPCQKKEPPEKLWTTWTVWKEWTAWAAAGG